MPHNLALTQNFISNLHKCFCNIYRHQMLKNFSHFNKGCQNSAAKYWKFCTNPAHFFKPIFHLDIITPDNFKVENRLEKVCRICAEFSIFWNRIPTTQKITEISKFQNLLCNPVGHISIRA